MKVSVLFILKLNNKIDDQNKIYKNNWSYMINAHHRI